jgi:hypothetical protein
VELSTPRPTPHMEDQASILVTLGDKMTHLYPQTHPRWDCSPPPVTTRRICAIRCEIYLSVLFVICLLAIDQRNGIVISCLFNNALSVNTECVVSNENKTGK